MAEGLVRITSTAGDVGVGGYVFIRFDLGASGWMLMLVVGLVR